MTGVELIARERERQQKELGYSAAHDAAYDNPTLVLFAQDHIQSALTAETIAETLVELQQAGALIAAELDRVVAKYFTEKTT